MKMILMRGVSGSGKSTLAEKIAEDLDGQVVICSADSFRYIDGEYIYNPSANKSVHAACFQLAKKAIEAGNHVICDNTNTSSWEMSKYIDLAISHDAEVFQCFVHEELDVHQIALYTERNIHNVPKDAIVRQYKNLLGDRQFGKTVGELVPIQ